MLCMSCMLNIKVCVVSEGFISIGFGMFFQDRVCSAEIGEVKDDVIQVGNHGLDRRQCLRTDHIGSEVLSFEHQRRNPSSVRVAWFRLG